MKLVRVILVIVHHHFRPGGVRRVIELAAPHLIEHWPEDVEGVLLVAGEAPDTAWLRIFRERVKGTPVKTLVLPSFGYMSEQKLKGEKLRQCVAHEILELQAELKRDSYFIWAHNLGLGRNLYLSSELTFACRCCSIPLLMHHHDWWFENRWHHFAAMREPGLQKLDAIANAVFADAPYTCHAAINQADATVLKKYFPYHAAWLPNMVEPAKPITEARVDAVRRWLTQQLGEDAPIWLLPCRLLRRKNIAEALLLARWLRPEAWLVTTGGVSSAEELAYAESLSTAAQKWGWRLRMGILKGDNDNQPAVQELMAASEAILLTSLQEGFGLPYLEAVAAGRPLIARELPNIAPDLEKFGFTFPHCYRELLVDPALFDWEEERKRQTLLFSEWKDLMPRTVSQIAGKPILLAAGKDPCPVPFSRLTLTAQLEVLTKPAAYSWERCVALNRFLKPWRDLASTSQLETASWPQKAERWLSGTAYAERFITLITEMTSSSLHKGKSKAAQSELLGMKLFRKNIYPLLWKSRT